MSSRHAVSDTERRAAASHVAEETIEDIQAMPYADIGLTSLPGSSSDPDNPNYYVSGGNYRPDQRTGGATATEPLVTDGALAPSSSWNDGRMSGTVYRYVTFASVGTTGTVKRVSVAVTATGGQRKGEQKRKEVSWGRGLNSGGA